MFERIYKITATLSFSKWFPSKLLLPSSEGSCSSLHRGQPTSSWLGGTFPKEQSLPNSQETACESFQTKAAKEELCQLVVVPWCPGLPRSLPHSSGKAGWNLWVFQGQVWVWNRNREDKRSSKTMEKHRKFQINWRVLHRWDKFALGKKIKQGSLYLRHI